MLKQIDHVVIVVPDLAKAVTDAQSAGFIVTAGGVHDAGGTHNALILFEDGSYVELLAFVDPHESGHHYFSDRHKLGGGLAEFAILSTDLDHDVRAIGQRGLRFPQPIMLGRNRPDGHRIEWRMSLPATEYPERGFPFLVEDTTDRILRAPSDPASTGHPNGAYGIAGITVVVPDLESTAPQYRAILDGPPDHTTNVGVAGKGIVRLAVPGSDHQWIALMQTFADSVPSAYFQRFGEGPYAVSLRKTAHQEVIPGEGTLIDPGLLGGARFYL